jgi:hypothetical protein
LDDFIDETVEFWHSQMRREVSREEARQIAENVSGFFRVLHEWDSAEQRERKEASEHHGKEHPGVVNIKAQPIHVTSNELPTSPVSSNLIKELGASAPKQRKMRLK